MGRYDRIKVYHNNQWKTPNQIRVYNNGSWVDLGTNDSWVGSNNGNYNSRYQMFLANGTRVTKYRKDTTTVTDQHTEGTFSLLPASGFCWCPSTGGAANFYFRCTAKKTTDAAKRLFYCGAGGSYVEIWWEADGRLKFVASYDYSPHYAYSINAVGANQYVYINVYSNGGSNQININFNGVTHSEVQYGQFYISNATNVVGDANICFKDNFSCCGCKWEWNNSKSIHAVSFNASTASGSDGSQYTGVTHRESSSTSTSWL